MSVPNIVLLFLKLHLMFQYLVGFLAQTYGKISTDKYKIHIENPVHEGISMRQTWYFLSMREKSRLFNKCCQINWVATCKLLCRILLFDHFHMDQGFRYISVNHAIIRTTLVDFYNLKSGKTFLAFNLRSSTRNSNCFDGKF